MKTLHTLPTKKLQNDEAGEFITKNYDDVMAAALDLKKDTRIEGYITKINADSTAWDIRILKSTKSPETDKLALLDTFRDRRVSHFFSQFRVYYFEDGDESIKIAYDALAIVFDMYDGLQRRNYGAETAGIRSLIEDLKTPENAPHVATLKLTELVNRMGTANDAFSKEFSKRNLSDSVKQAMSDNKLFRIEMFEHYQEYADYVLSMARDEKSANFEYYNRLFEIVNQLRKYFSDVVAAREGRKIASKTAKE